MKVHARCCGHSDAVREDPKHQLVDHEDEADQGGADWIVTRPGIKGHVKFCSILSVCYIS